MVRSSATWAPNFARVNYGGIADYYFAAYTYIRVPLCFLVT